jgi:putative protease
MAEAKPAKAKPIKAEIKKIEKEVKKEAEKIIGEVSNYFEKIGVAAIKLVAPLKIGEKVRFKGGETDFEQKVESMQIHNAAVEKAKKGEEIGMKVTSKVHKNYKVLKA